MKSVKRALFLIIVLCWGIFAFGATKPGSGWKLFAGISRTTLSQSVETTVPRLTLGIGMILRLNRSMTAEFDIYRINRDVRSKRTYQIRKLSELCGALLIRVGGLRLAPTENIGTLNVFVGYEFGIIINDFAEGISRIERGLVAGFGYRKWLKNGKHGFMLEFRNRFEGPDGIPYGSRPYRSAFHPRTMSFLVGYMYRRETGSKR